MACAFDFNARRRSREGPGGQSYPVLDNNRPLAFLIEALITHESLLDGLPTPVPVFARELLAALEAAEGAGAAKS